MRPGMEDWNCQNKNCVKKIIQLINKYAKKCNYLTINLALYINAPIYLISHFIYLLIFNIYLWMYLSVYYFPFLPSECMLINQ